MSILTTKDVNKNDSAIVVFTRGDNTELSHIHESMTGEWKVSKSTEFKKVIVYHRDDDTKVNTVFKADYASRSDANNGKVYIHMNNVKRVGTTESNWTQFTGASAGNSRVYMNIEK